MGLFSRKKKSKLQGKIIVVEDKKTENKPEKQSTEVSLPKLHAKGKKDAFGLYPADLVMLFVAEKYLVTENHYPAYLTYDYEIVNPQKTLKSLQKKGFLEIGSAIDSLSYFKVAELKDIAGALGISVKGKKADMIARISEADNGLLDTVVTNRTWKRTQKGEEAIQANPYVEYFLARHTYDVREVGINIWTVNEEYVQTPDKPYRDCIWGQLNGQLHRSFVSMQENGLRANNDIRTMCECYRMMALFLEEEGKSYKDALKRYLIYLYKWNNFYQGLQLLWSYDIFGKDQKSEETFSYYYNQIKLMPFQTTDLLRLIDEAGIPDEEFRSVMLQIFAKSKDVISVMDEAGTADFIILELNGNCDQSCDMAIKYARRFVKKNKMLLK